MKKLMIAALVCLSILMAATGLSALSDTFVASVNGTAYDSLQEAFDAAAQGGTAAERVVVLLKDVNLGKGSVALKSGDVTLDLNGHTITGTAQALIVLKNGARLSVRDAKTGGTIRSAAKGKKDGGCAILVEGGSKLTINGGTIDASGKNNSGVRCGAGSAVVVNGGSVDGIALAEGAEPVRNRAGQKLFQYDLTIGSPPLRGAEVFGLAAAPGPSRSYGPALVTLSVVPNAGYVMVEGSMKVNGAPQTGVTFVMPAQDVTVMVMFQQAPPFGIEVIQSANGTIGSSRIVASYGTEVLLTISPVTGYRLVAGSLTVNGEAIPSTAFTSNPLITNGLFATFPMPAQNVVVTASFEENVYTLEDDFEIFVKFKDTSRVFACTGPFADFTGMSIDGVMCDSSWYTVSSVDIGTQIRVKDDKLDTLAAGYTYNIVFYFSYGKAYARISVHKPPDGTFQR